VKIYQGRGHVVSDVDLFCTGCAGMDSQASRGVHAGRMQLEELCKRGSFVGTKTVSSVFTTVAENLDFFFFLLQLYSVSGGAPQVALVVKKKKPTCHCRRHKRCKFDPRARKIPWRRARQPTLVFLPEKSHGQRNLMGHSLWSHRESDMTEATRAW